MTIKTKLKSIITPCLALGLGFAALPAQAHFPLMSCWFEGKTVACEAGYSDGSKAIDYAVEMYDYEDNLIAKEMTDKRSIVEFPNLTLSSTLYSIQAMSFLLKSTLLRSARNDDSRRTC